MKAFIWILLAGAATACTSQEDQNLEAAQRMFDAFNRHDWAAMANCYSDTALFLDPSFGTEYVTKSRQETTAKYQELEQLFPNVRDEVVMVCASGDKVTVEFISTGNSGDSISLRLPIATVLTFKDGLIVKDATYYDQ